MSKRTLEDLSRQYNKSGSYNGASGYAGGKRRHTGPGLKPRHAAKTFKRLFAYLSAYKLRMAVVLLVMAVNTAGSISASYMLRPIMNDYIAAGRPEGFIYAIGILAFIYILTACAAYVQSRLMIGISQNAVENIRNDLFNKLQHLPVSFYDNESSGDIMSRFTNDIDNIDVMINNSIISVISGVITLTGTLAMMLRMNIWLTMITIAFIPLFFAGGRIISRFSRRYNSMQQASLGAVNGYIEETVSGQKVIKVFNHEESCIEEFDLLNSDLREKQMRSQFYGGLMAPVMGNASQISYALTAGIGGIFVALGKFDIGGLTVFVNYSRQFSMPINQIAMQMSTFFSALAGAERVFDILDREEEGTDDENAVDPAEIKGNVRLEHVTFGYDKDIDILKDISLYAGAGQKIALVGSTGAGKTTVTNLLNRFYDIKSGRITIDGIDISKFRRSSLRKNIAMVLQDTHLFTGTVMENIRYGRLDATDEEVITASKTAGAHEFITRLENGYDTMLDGDGANLSQGQRQLLNIARAALSRAHILVLDEATSSVDTRTERLIEKGMDALMKDCTTFVIAHRLSTVRNADSIMVLEHGEIIERGSHEELLKIKGRYHELYTGRVELE